MSVGGVKPVMGNGTRWIDYKVRAMRRVVEKFGLYIKHLKGTIPTIKSSNDRCNRKFLLPEKNYSRS